MLYAVQYKTHDVMALYFGFAMQQFSQLVSSTNQHMMRELKC